jgi:antitoxin CcdA
MICKESTMARSTRSARTVSATPPTPRIPEIAQQSTSHLVRQTQAAYDVSAPKRATNVSINVDLLAQARDLGVNLSQTLEEGLKVRLAEERRKRWLADNRDAIAEYNKHFEKYGLWSDGLRMF